MTEALIREFVENWAKAISAKDIEQVVSRYSPDVVSFDLDPPLRYAGSNDKRRAWEQFFAGFSGRVRYEVSELTVTAGADTAFAHSLNHVQGHRHDGQQSDMWVRWTACLRRVDNAWLIVHDHASVPADVPNARAVLTLTP